MTDAEPREPVPPYVSFGTLLNQLDRMAKEGVPSRVDSSYLVGMAGGTQAQFKQALRSLGLINEDDSADPKLPELAKATDERPALMAAILRSRYPRMVALDQNATRGQLDDALATYGLGTDTRRKAATFYIAAATYAKLPLSSHLRSGRATASGGTPRRKPRVAKKSAPDAGGIGGSTATSSGSPEDMRRAYFDLLLSKAKDADDLDSGLLDRIERLIEVPTIVEEVSRHEEGVQPAAVV